MVNENNDAAPAADDPPNPTWDDLVDSLSLAPHEVGYQLRSEHGVPNLSAGPSVFEALTAPSTNNSANALLLRQSSAEGRTFTLVALQDRVAVLYDLKKMFELDPQGGRYAALGGDTRKVSGQTIFPHLYHQPDSASRTAHRATFATREVPALAWDAIATDLEADGASSLVSQAEASEEQETAPTVHAHLSLPLSPQLAILFMRMPTFRAAFELCHSLRGLIPVAQRGSWDPLFNFMRAAITRDAEHPNRSAMASNWAQLVVQAGTSLETRYYSMVGKLVPTPEPSTPDIRTEPQTDARSDNRTSDPTTTDTEKSKYQTYELRTLWSLSGHASETFPALTEAALPTFWQQFKKHRASNAEARNFMESFLRSWKNTERIVTPFVWQPSVIRAARNINFGADDIAYQWTSRDRGFSYLMLGPHEAFQSGSYVHTTEDWKIVEGAEDDGKLSLAERRESRRSSGLCPAVPSDRMTTIRHMECVCDKLIMMFGDKNPITPYLQSYVVKISEEAVMGSWHSDDWKAFNWLVATGVRKVFNECHQGVDREALAFLVRINNDLSQGRRFSKEECPEQLFATKVPDKSELGKRPGEDLARIPSKKTTGRSGYQGASHAIAENFVTMFKEAKEALGNKRVGVGTVLTNKADLHHVLGSDFQATVKDGEPCMKYFFSRCFKEDCPYSHKLSSTPSKAVLEGMVQRLKQKVEEYVKKQAGKK